MHVTPTNYALQPESVMLDLQARREGEGNAMKDPRRVEAGRKAYQTYKKNAKANRFNHERFVAELAAKVQAAADALKAERG